MRDGELRHRMGGKLLMLPSTVFCKHSWPLITQRNKGGGGLAFECVRLTFTTVCRCPGYHFECYLMRQNIRYIVSICLNIGRLLAGPGGYGFNLELMLLRVDCQRGEVLRARVDCPLLTRTGNTCSWQVLRSSPL